ncbi:hypothetical protein G9464_12650 [Halostella sp. JP-L12]|uniref:hypothetical protein n=1 Tax=Halostella TaxID=1843185 RepID=UPI000EF7EAD9|nr:MULTISPECIES: hypothetical protein [Halostella]NHN48437.1 hypothetical protein [Halostella sp. JP-L12]
MFHPDFPELNAVEGGLALFALLVALVVVGAVLAYRVFAHDEKGVNRLDGRVDAAFRAGLIVGAPAMALGLVGVLGDRYVGGTLATVGFALLVLGTGVVTLTVGGFVANLIVLSQTADR